MGHGDVPVAGLKDTVRSRTCRERLPPDGAAGIHGSALGVDGGAASAFLMSVLDCHS